MNFKPVVDLVLFQNQDDGNTSFCYVGIPSHTPDLKFSTVYLDDDEVFFLTDSGEIHQIPPPADMEEFLKAVSMPQQYFIPVFDGEVFGTPYEGRFLSTPPSPVLGV
jgi:hypothetical protein